MTHRIPILLSLFGFGVLGCASSVDDSASSTGSVDQAIGTVGHIELNHTAGSLVLYEVQVRSANACHPDVGSSAQREACRVKPAPVVRYRAEGTSCGNTDRKSVV